MGATVLGSTFSSLLVDAKRVSKKTGPIPWDAVCLPEFRHLDALSWSLEEIYHPDDVSKTLSSSRLIARLGAVLGELEASRAHAPSVADASGAFIDPTRLRRVIPIRNGISLLRKKDVPASATALRKPGDAFVMSARGNGLFILTGNTTCIVGDVQRDTLLPREFTEKGIAVGNQVSVVTTCIEELKRREPELDLGKACFRVVFCVSPKHFRHSLDDERNARRAKYLESTYGRTFTVATDGLDLPAIALRQAHDMGVKDAGSNEKLPYGQKFAFPGHPDEHLRHGSNLLAVVRHG
jgi:hypothetical protein